MAKNKCSGCWAVAVINESTHCAAPRCHKDLQFVPITPAGTACTWLASKTEDEAWRKLLEDAAHMPYKTKENFIKRGYTVEKIGD